MGRVGPLAPTSSDVGADHDPGPLSEMQWLTALAGPDGPLSPSNQRLKGGSVAFFGEHQIATRFEKERELAGP